MWQKCKKKTCAHSLPRHDKAAQTCEEEALLKNWNWRKQHKEKLQRGLTGFFVRSVFFLVLAVYFLFSFSQVLILNRQLYKQLIHVLLPPSPSSPIFSGGARPAQDLSASHTHTHTDRDRRWYAWASRSITLRKFSEKRWNKAVHHFLLPSPYENQRPELARTFDFQLHISLILQTRNKKDS